MTRAGSATIAAFYNNERQAQVRWKITFTLSANTLSQTSSKYATMKPTQFAPALFTKMSNFTSRCPNAYARPSQPACVPQSADSEMQVPSFESSAAAASQTSALRDEMYTLAPAST